MRISELSARTGVTVADDQVLPARRAPARGRAQLADPGDLRRAHVERLRVIRALIESGVSIAETPQGAGRAR